MDIWRFFGHVKGEAEIGEGCVSKGVSLIDRPRVSATKNLIYERKKMFQGT